MNSHAAASALTLSRDGAQLLPGAASGVLGRIEGAVAGLPADRAGVRLHGLPALTRLLSAGEAIGDVATALLGDGCRPVRAILFDKSAVMNWSLPWHQDRTIALQERVETPDFGPWTIKRGMPHVAPPFELLAEMLTLRVHLDRVSSANAPLMIAPGSHRMGRIPETQVAEAVVKCGVVSCLADAGDIWVYSTPILHASEAAARPARRRVLQIDFAKAELPGELRWLGV